MKGTVVRCRDCGELMRAAAGVVPVWRCACGREIPRTGGQQT